LKILSLCKKHTKTNKACLISAVASGTPIVLVGPTHPYTGGISQHTTRLALELEKAGHNAVVESWKAQYPKRLYPGTITIPDSEPEIGLPTQVVRKLAWYSPLSWFLAGRRHRTSRIVLSIPTAFHAVPYWVLAKAAGKNSDLWGIVHNVIPHDSGRLSRALMAQFVKRLKRIIVHGDEAKKDALALGCANENITVTTLPSPWPPITAPEPTHNSSGSLRALFFGAIRPYKGLDLLLEALAKTSHVSLTIAGEFWEDRSRYDDLITRLGITDRVTIIAGYLPRSRFPEIFGSADAVVLPYRQGTGSIVRELGFSYGLPVIATEVGAIGDGIDNDHTGLLITPNSVNALTDALIHASNPDTRKRWVSAVAARQSTQQHHWDNYVRVVTAG
jgi:glycosyltransferase involved in cell wall biosynthesis